jgi:hypothetical protein
MAMAKWEMGDLYSTLTLQLGLTFADELFPFVLELR